MGLKGYRLWDMGQLDSTCRAPHHYARQEAVGKRGEQHPLRSVVGGGVVVRQAAEPLLRAVERRILGVALQVAFERQTLKPVFSLDRLYEMGLKGYMLLVMGQLDSTCRAPPWVACPR